MQHAELFELPIPDESETTGGGVARLERGDVSTSLSRPLRFICLLLCFSWVLHGCGTQDKRVTREPMPTGLRQELVMVTLSQLETPYRSGRSRPSEGFDCSGLVQYVHGSVGIRVPRMAQEQWAAAQPVGKTERQPGDLVFFRIAEAKYHVGILVDARRFVHAPGSGKGVRLAELDNPYWAERYLSAGSFLP